MKGDEERMKIGVFDSGYGGLTVLARCLEAVEPQGKAPTFVYYADSDYAPYGERSAAEVQALTQRAIRFLIEEEQVALVIIACNTATSLAIETLRAECSIPIIGIEPAIKPASQHREAGEMILVTATPLMTQSERLNRRIQELGLENRVERLALPGLVQIAEHPTLTWEEKQVAAKDYLEAMIPQQLSRRCGSVVLGCTHFPIFLSAYQAVFESRGHSKVYFADGSEGVARAFVQALNRHSADNSSTDATVTIRFYQSSRLLEGAEEIRFQQLLNQIQQSFSAERK